MMQQNANRCKHRLHCVDNIQVCFVKVAFAIKKYKIPFVVHHSSSMDLPPFFHRLVVVCHWGIIICHWDEQSELSSYLMSN